jgi:hypothetical protein
VRGISNYIAAVITVTMIFTSLAFFISTMIKQVEISNYALNNMVSISDRARENLGISYIFPDNESIIITIVNRGTIEVTLSYVVFIDKHDNVYTINVNSTTIPISSIVNLKLQLPIPRDEIDSIKIATMRGNMFDVLSSIEEPIDMIIYTNATTLKTGDEIEVVVIVKNTLYRNILLERTNFNITFVDHVTGENITRYFLLEEYYPDEPLVLPQGGETIYRFVYQYEGGLQTGTIADIYVRVYTTTTTYEEVYSSAHLYYAFETR